MRSRTLAPLVLIALALALPAAGGAQNAAPPEPEAIPGEVPTAPVEIDHRELFRVRGTSSYPATTRAAVFEQRILEIARDPRVRPEEIAQHPTELGVEIRAGDRTIATVLPVDAALEGMSAQELAKGHVLGIRSAVAEYRASRSTEKLRRGALLSLAATLMLVVASFVTSRLLVRLAAALEKTVSGQIAEAAGEIPGKASPVAELVASALRSARWIALIALSYVWAQFVLGQFPWTRWLSTDLGRLVFAPLGEISIELVQYVPKLLFLLTLAVLTRYGLRLLRLYFTSLERGRISLRRFEPTWADPAYKAIRTLVVALVLVAAYPYLPGAGSEALQGISLLGGLMLSLGASIAVGNVIAGYVHIFGRAFKIGDVIEVGEIRGEVTEVRLLNTRLRTIKNEEVTLSNAAILGSSLINYSALAQTRGLILHTEVGVGYDVPWRQVHAMLEEAARRTPDILTDPPPFILQRKLGDFAVVYQLNVYTRTAVGMPVTYNKLHQNVLDLFNEHGVQIMTPAYESDPAAPKVVPHAAWFAPPARPPEGRS